MRWIAALAAYFAALLAVDQVVGVRIVIRADPQRQALMDRSAGQPVMSRILRPGRAG